MLIGFLPSLSRVYCYYLHGNSLCVDVFRLKPLMEALPTDLIDYNRLKIVRAILVWEYVPDVDLEKPSQSGSVLFVSLVVSTGRK